MSETVVIDQLEYQVRRSDRRKTIGITVDRDGAVVMHVPKGCRRAVMDRVGRQKNLWVHSKLAEKDLMFRRPRQREFVSGEGFHYLGRSYRLLLVPGRKGSPLRLHEGRFKLLRGQARHGQEHFRRWYTEHATPWIQQRVKLFSPRVGAEPAAVVVRELGYRWGSCAQDGTLYFHWCTACLPPRIVEYLVVHEMVHLVQGRHNAEFWLRLERIIPDWRQRKQWLAAEGARYV